MTNNQEFDYDYIVIGSGFGGAVSALRLSEKGYRVLVIEKGKRLSEEDFPACSLTFRIQTTHLFLSEKFRIENDKKRADLKRKRSYLCCA